LYVGKWVGWKVGRQIGRYPDDRCARIQCIYSSSNFKMTVNDKLKEFERKRFWPNDGTTPPFSRRDWRNESRYFVY
jgi:hypothetical protein